MNLSRARLVLMMLAVLTVATGAIALALTA